MLKHNLQNSRKNTKYSKFFNLLSYIFKLLISIIIKYFYKES